MHVLYEVVWLREEESERACASAHMLIETLARSVAPWRYFICMYMYACMYLMSHTTHICRMVTEGPNDKLITDTEFWSSRASNAYVPISVLELVFVGICVVCIVIIMYVVRAPDTLDANLYMIFMYISGVLGDLSTARNE